MSFESSALLDALPDVLVGSGIRAEGGATAFRLNLGKLPVGCAITFAELILPKGFPEHAVARIRLSEEAILRVPHVEAGGLLCIDGDPGPGLGYDGVQRVHILLTNFYNNFFGPWSRGKLDGDFSNEPQNYWAVNVDLLSTKNRGARKVWTVDDVPITANVREGLLLLPGRVIVADDINNQFVQRIVSSLGKEAKQRVRVIVADIPISCSFVPDTWPKDLESLMGVLRARLSRADYRRFAEQPIRKRRVREHRLVLFRNREGGFAFLLPGGPPIIVREVNRHRAAPSSSLIQPLVVERIDPSWTVGRDAISQVSARQAKHLVVFGAGALGSPVIEQLAKAGIGKITLIDPDIMETANLGRHLLGVQHLDSRKSFAVAYEVNQKYPACIVRPFGHRAEEWLRTNSLQDVDLVMDLTGEPGVRWYLNEARRQHPCKLLVGWMEPFVAAAHACLLTSDSLWFPPGSNVDRLGELEAVDWPSDVIRQVPGCSSRFQAYTSANAAYAVALVSENALRLIDNEVTESTVISWIRGQDFLDRHYKNLKHRDWAAEAANVVGLTKERPFI